MSESSQVSVEKLPSCRGGTSQVGSGRPPKFLSKSSQVEAGKAPKLSLGLKELKRKIALRKRAGPPAVGGSLRWPARCLRSSLTASGSQRYSVPVPFPPIRPPGWGPLANQQRGSSPMIEPIPNCTDRVWISFGDWTPSMMALASKLNRKPDRPGDDRPRSHELGVDRLSSLPRGRLAIDALFDVADELPYCPDHEEILALGKVLIASHVELEVLCESRRRNRTYLRDREKKKTAPKKRVISCNLPTNGKIGFVRRK